MGVDAATDSIRDDLSQGWTDWDVTAGELRSINDTLADLSPEDRNEVIARLSDEELGHWAGEVDSWVNGLSASERGDLLDMLAGSLDGEQLARVADAFGIEAVTGAVVAHGDADTKLEYIQALQGQADGSARISVGFLGSSTTTSYGNEQAHAIAGVLASMGDSPEAFAQGVAGLDSAGKLDDVMAAAAGRSYTTYNSYGSGVAVPHARYEASALNDILEIAAGTDLDTRLTVFDGAAEQLRHMQVDSAGLIPSSHVNAAADETAQAMAGVLSRDEAFEAGIVDVPTYPSDVSLDANIELAQDHTLDMPWFYNQVRNGGPWDYKQQGAEYQDFGNFNYGMTAAAAGIPIDVALRAAGWAQQQAGTSDDDWGGPFDFNGGPYGDDPADQEQIRAGYGYHQSGLWRIWPD